MDALEAQQKLESALGKLVERDAFLLEIDANERSISHRLAVYLEQEYPGWDVDCEYNRDLQNPKEPLNLPVDIAYLEPIDTDAKTVFPDIVIHKRGTNDNLLVIEMKKTTSCVNDCFDHQKLDAFKNQLGYKHAVFVKVITAENAGYQQPIWL